MDSIEGVDAIILAVSHKIYEGINLEDLKSKYRNGSYVLIDVKGMFEREYAEELGYLYWRL